VFIIRIPQGSTAYQANDGRYYGRSEFEAKHLPDHEVRLQMSRGKVAHGTILCRLVAIELGVERETRRRAEVEARRAEMERRSKEGQPLELEVERRNPDGTIVWYDPYSILELRPPNFFPTWLPLPLR